MAYSNNSSASSSNSSLVQDSSQKQIERRRPGTVSTRSSRSKQVAQPSPAYYPTADELDRMERYMAIQARMAQLNNMPRQGHSYGKVTVSGNARAIRGNLYDDSSSPSSLRQHTYGDAVVREGGMVWDGDVSVSAFKRQTSSRS